MGKLNPFRGAAVGTVVINAGTASTVTQFNPPPQSPNALDPVVKVFNGGTVPVFVEFGGANATAIVPAVGQPGSMPIPPNESKIYATGSQSFCAAITASGTAQLYLTPGFGT